MFKLKDKNRYTKTYPLKRLKPVYTNEILNEENQVLVPLDYFAGELLNLFTDDCMDDVFIDTFRISSKKKIFIINTQPFDLDILKGDIIMHSNYSDNTALDYSNEMIFNGWFNQGSSPVNENTKYFDLIFDSNSQLYELIFTGIIPEFL
jgi:hypothetical protein